MTRIECAIHTQQWLIVPALLGVILLTYLVAKHNNLGLKDSLLAAVGLRKINRTKLINIVHVATLLAPLALVMWQMKLCDPTLFGI